MSRRKIAAALAVVMSIGLASCSPKGDDKPAANPAQESTVTSPLVTESEKAADTTSEAAAENEETSAVTAEEKTEASAAAESSEKTVFKIFSKDPVSMKKIEVSEVTVNDNAPIEEKISSLMDALAKDVFKGKKMALKEIADEDGKKIAYIDLEGKDSWNEAFQGTTGGAVTQSALIDSILQRDYEGEWIDGVRFTTDGEDINSDHVPGLSGTRFRTENAN